MHTHLKMEGRWRIAPASERLRESYRIRLILANDQWRATGYELGIVELLPTAQEERITGHLGPDLLGPDWDQTEAVRRLSADPERSACEALLDQRNLAGIGNVYKSEPLFLRGIRPWRPVGKVHDVDALVSLSHRMLNANKDRVKRVTTGDARRGHETWVYGRRGQPCLALRHPHPVGGARRPDHLLVPVMPAGLTGPGMRGSSSRYYVLCEYAAWSGPPSIRVGQTDTMTVDEP